MDADYELLRKNGWIITCESPFEIEHEETGSRATLWASRAVVDDLRRSETMGSLLLIKDAYQADLIDKDKFVAKIIETLERD